jgi:hypothetical protein
MLAFFISPSVGATQSAGQSFMRHFMGKTRFNLVMWSSALLTILAGTILYWIDSEGFTSAWMTSGPGVGFSAGAAFALLGLITGIYQSRNSNALAQLGGQIQSQGTPPTPEQSMKIGNLQKTLGIGGMLNATFLILALSAMAIARFLSF